MSYTRKFIEENYNSIFATRLRNLKEEKNVSQAEISKFVGCTPQAIGAYMRGETMPKITDAEKIAQYFNVSMDYLIGLSDIVLCDEEIKNVNRVTGLKEQAIINLRALKATNEFIDIVNEMLSSKYIIPFLNAVSLFLHGDGEKEKIMQILQEEMLKTSAHLDRYTDIENSVWYKVTQKAVIEELMWKMIIEQGKE